MLIGLFVFSRILKYKKMTRLLYVLAAVIAVALYFDPHIVPRYDILGDSMTDRFHIWSASFRDFLNNPVFGRGLLAFFQVSGNRITPHAHNLYIDLLESFGITGTAVFLIFFFTVVKQLVIAFKYGGEKEKLHAALSSAVLVVTLVHGLVDTPIMGFQTGLFLTLLLALRPKVVFSAAPKKAYNANYALGYKR
jgi:O-antigen ligase